MVCCFQLTKKAEDITAPPLDHIPSIPFRQAPRPAKHDHPGQPEPFRILSAASLLGKDGWFLTIAFLAPKAEPSNQ
jgi:hypothetical protein